MQFTQVTQLNNLIQTSRSKNQQSFQNSSQGNNVNSPQNLDAQQMINIDEIMNDIHIHAKSLLIKLSDSNNKQVDDIRNESVREGNKLQKEKESEEIVFNKKKHEEKMHIKTYRNSNVFHKKKNQFMKREKEIKVYYFSLPIFKIISYSKQTTVQDLIEEALISYLDDDHFDKNKIKTTKKQAYVVRLVEDDQIFKPDLQLQPLDFKMKLSETSFEQVVLLQNNNIQFGLEKYDQSPLYKSRSCYGKLIRIFDEDTVQLAIRNFENDKNVLQIYEFINNLCKEYEKKDYYLADNPDGIYQISKQIKISELQSNKLYIKIKKYADEPLIVEQEIHKEDNVYQQSVVPINLSLASLYEQFEVIKINGRGVRQHRILGIDQNKLYNFDKQFRTKRKQVNLLQKFFGKNEDFGTKNPERMIKDIVSVRQKQQKNRLIIEVRERESKIKQLKYEASKQIRAKILKKLSFLMNLKENK